MFFELILVLALCAEPDTCDPAEPTTPVTRPA